MFIIYIYKYIYIYIYICLSSSKMYWVKQYLSKNIFYVKKYVTPHFYYIILNKLCITYEVFCIFTLNKKCYVSFDKFNT